MALNINNFTKFKNFATGHPLTNEIWIVGYDHNAHNEDVADSEVRLRLSDILDYIGQDRGSGFSLWRVTVPVDASTWLQDESDDLYKCVLVESLNGSEIKWWDPNEKIFQPQSEYSNDPSLFCNYISRTSGVADVFYDDSNVAKYSKMMECGMFGSFDGTNLTLCSIENPSDAGFSGDKVSFLVKVYSNITNPY